MKVPTCLAVANSYRCLLFSMILLLTFSTQAQTVRMRANLYVVDASGPTLMDGNMTNYHSMYSNEVDGYDIWKMSNFGENFGILRSGANLVIERRSLVAVTDTTYFRLWNLVQGRNYRISVVAENLNTPGMQGFIVDKYLQKTIPVLLNGTTDVDFLVNGSPASFAQNRFSFLLADGALMAGPLSVTFTGINAQLTSNKSAKVLWSVENEVGMNKYVVQHSADGASFKDIAETQALQQLQRNSYSVDDLSNVVANNFYRVKAISLSGKIQYSAVAKLSAKQENIAVDIYPNPVANKTMNLEVNAAQAAVYSFTLISNNGVQIPIGKVNLQAGFNRQQLTLPAAITPGTYHLKITTSDQRTLLKTITVL